MGSFRRLMLNEKGMTTLVVAALAAGFLVIAAAFFSIRKGSEMGAVDGLRFYSAVDTIKANIYFFGQNVGAWSATLAYNKSQGRMTQIDTGGNCTVNATFGSDEKVVLVNGDSSVYYQGTPLDLSTTAGYNTTTDATASDGFKYDGNVCDYIHTEVRRGCAIQVDIRWRPFCDTSCPCGTNYNRIVFHGFWRSPNKSSSNKELWGYEFNLSRVNGLIAF